MLARLEKYLEGNKPPISVEAISAISGESKSSIRSEIEDGTILHFLTIDQAESVSLLPAEMRANRLLDHHLRQYPPRSESLNRFIDSETGEIPLDSLARWVTKQMPGLNNKLLQFERLKSTYFSIKDNVLVISLSLRMTAKLCNLLTLDFDFNKSLYTAARKNSFWLPVAALAKDMEVNAADLVKGLANTNFQVQNDKVLVQSFYQKQAEPTEVDGPQELVQQLEFYFRDYNYLSDSFLQELAAGDAGWIPLDTILAFPLANKIIQERKLTLTPESLVRLFKSSQVVEVQLQAQKRLKIRKRGEVKIRRLVMNPSAKVGDPRMFSIMTYNVLADSLCTLSQFPTTEPQYLIWDYRRRAIVQQLLYHRPSLICLQELESIGSVDDTSPENHAGWLANVLSTKEYAIQYARKAVPKSVQGPVIGNAVIADSRLFEIKDVQVINLGEELRAISRDSPLANRYSQVALVADVRQKTTKRQFWVVSVHLSADWKRRFIQVLQAWALATRLSQITGPNPALFVCGDYNSTPDSAVYQLLTQGCLDPTIETELRNSGRAEGFQFPKAPLTHNLKLRSAYSSMFSREPPFTNKVHNFTGTLDYIFYTNETLKLDGVLDMPILSTEHYPNAINASDHLPIMAVIS